MPKLIYGRDLDQECLYHVTEHNERSSGVQYQDGWITDPLPFNPDGQCEGGGLYFFDIRYYSSYRGINDWIRKVTIDPDEPVWDDGNGKYKVHRFCLGPRVSTEEFKIPEKYRMEAVDVSPCNLLYVQQDPEFCWDCLKKNISCYEYIKEKVDGMKEYYLQQIENMKPEFKKCMDIVCDMVYTLTDLGDEIDDINFFEWKKQFISGPNGYHDQTDCGFVFDMGGYDKIPAKIYTPYGYVTPLGSHSYKPDAMKELTEKFRQICVTELAKEGYCNKGYHGPWYNVVEFNGVKLPKTIECDRKDYISNDIVKRLWKDYVYNSPKLQEIVSGLSEFYQEKYLKPE